MPHIRLPNRAPLARPANIPSQRRIRVPALTTDPSSLQLREMAFEEADLVFAVDAWGVCRASLDAEMVPYLSGVDGCFCLRNQLCASHRLSVPVCSAVECELRALLGPCICGVFVTWRQVHVAGYGA